jgi:hypothetical protein
MQRKATKDVAAGDYEVTDENAELVEADELDEDLLDEGGTFRLGQQDEEFHDFSALKLKDDAHNRQVNCGQPANNVRLGRRPPGYQPVYESTSQRLILTPDILRLLSGLHACPQANLGVP